MRSGPFFFSIPLASEQKRDRHVDFMDRAKLLDFRNARFGGQGLGNNLGPFFTLRPSGQKRPLLVAWPARDSRKANGSERPVAF
jgi:hypothetical protein